MTCKTVTTQAQLDTALADKSVDCLHIESPTGVWIDISANPDHAVEASGSASVRAYGSASVSAYGSASVSAYDSASVSAYGSASVSAYGSASVSAYDSASVSAYDSASVSAYDSASVSAYDSASVRAYDSASVSAYGSASVSAYDSASVHASSHVAVHLHSKRVRVAGGVVIDVTDLDQTDVDVWAGYTGTEVVDGRVVLYKALGADLTAGTGYGYTTAYAVGAVMVAEDWRDSHECGGGFHLSPTAHQATAYRPAATRWLRCTADVADVRPIVGGTAKCKVRQLTVEAEVDEFGRDITPAVALVAS